MLIVVALTSDFVESLDYVGPNPLPCVGEGIQSLIRNNGPLLDAGESFDRLRMSGYPGVATNDTVFGARVAPVP